MLFYPIILSYGRFASGNAVVLYGINFIGFIAVLRGRIRLKESRVTPEADRRVRKCSFEGLERDVPCPLSFESFGVVQELNVLPSCNTFDGLRSCSASERLRYSDIAVELVV